MTRRAKPAEALTPGDWAMAALKALARGGAEAVRVEKLAKAMGVTKGSFYWHFADREALVAAMIALWEEKATLSIMRDVEAAGGPPDVRFRTLMERAVLGRPDRLEGAMRAFATVHPRAAAAVKRADAVREGYVAGLLAEQGFRPDDARVRAALLYRALIGEWTLAATRNQVPDLGAWAAAADVFANTTRT